MRSELIHPMIVHFPIVLTILLIFIKLIELITKNKEHQKILSHIFFVTLTLALISSFISMYLGDMAFDELKGKICKISLVDFHEENSRDFTFALFFLFFVNTVNLALGNKIKLSIGIKNIINIFLILPIIFLLFKTAHTGATLVYEHGVAVTALVKNCQ